MKNVLNLLLIFLSVITLSCQDKKEVLEKDSSPVNGENVESPSIPSGSIKKELKKMALTYNQAKFYFEESTYIKSCDFVGIFSGEAVFKMEIRTFSVKDSTMFHEVIYAKHCNNIFMSGNQHASYYAEYDMEIDFNFEGLLNFDYTMLRSKIWIDTQIGKNVFISESLVLDNNCTLDISDMSILFLQTEYDTSTSSFCFIDQKLGQKQFGHAFIDENDFSVMFNEQNDLEAQNQTKWRFYEYNYYNSAVDDITPDLYQFYFAQMSGLFLGGGSYWNPMGFDDYYDMRNFPEVKYYQKWGRLNSASITNFYTIEYDITFVFEGVDESYPSFNLLHQVKLEVHSAKLTSLHNTAKSYLIDNGICGITAINNHQPLNVLGKDNCTPKSRGFEYTYLIFDPDNYQIIIGEYDDFLSSKDGSSSEQRFDPNDNLDETFVIDF